MTAATNNRKIRVLFVIEQSAVSYKYFENMLIELGKTPGIEVEVLNLIKDNSVNKHLANFCSRVITFPNDAPYRKQVFNVARIIRQSNPDIIHAHEVIPSFYAAMALIASFSGKKLIFHRHHSFYRNNATRFMERIAFWRCNIAISVSKTTQQQAFLEHPFNKGKILQLYNGITVTDNGLSLPVDLASFKSHHKIVLLSRLRTRKGHGTAIKAIELVIKKIPNVVLFFAGEGEYRKELENMIAEKKLQQHVILLGDVQNIKPLLLQMDLSILPSESEAFNLSILETLSCKCLSIASNLPSIRECITDEQTGILINPGDAGMLADKIIFYLKNKAKKDEIAQKGYDLYNEKFTTSAMVKKMATIYYSLLSGKKTKPS